jgi:uncharacterized phage-associated protein
MEKVDKIAAYIYHQYKERFGDTIDEMKLHKLLYFGQRESFVLYDEPLFEGTFYAGQYGPVVLEVRELYHSKRLTEMPSEEFINERKEVFEKLWSDYASKTACSLSRLSHGEISWKNAYEKMKHPQDRYQKIEDEDIRKDAIKIKRRRERMVQS